MRGIEFDVLTYFNLTSTFLLGVGTSHLYRNFIIRFDWLRLKIAQLIPRVILASFILALIFYTLHTLISDVVMLGRMPAIDLLDILQSLINLSANFILWTLIYWSFHFIENYRKEEIKNLKWQATINEMELNKIKSQLNPHFIFNSMNSIRALVDESPAKAKNLITQLSNILRSSLYMERKPVIAFNEELSLVRDYLELEKARLESRLDYRIDVDPECAKYEVPPLLLQTLVENGIKHGINHQEKGGKLLLKAYEEGGKLKVDISNTGKIVERGKGKPGIGLKISQQRLKLLYGQQASLNIEEKDNMVVAAVSLPAQIEKLEIHEDIDR